MLFSKAAVLALGALGAVAADSDVKEPSKYYADMGMFGTFELEISADDGTMTWTSDLHNIDKLAEELGIEGGIPTLNYHLHQSWTLDSDYAIGGEECGLANLGNHYDPYFACGPASGNANETCIAIGRPRTSERYMCSGSYEQEMYNECEVGDLSGKEGALVVMDDGTASGSPDHPDPLAALDTEFVAERGLNPADKWSSILFHDGSPRVLCAKLYEGALPPKVDPIIKKGYIEVTNKAPMYGTCQTPVWVGIHDGTFDTYDRDVELPAFMEALVEDGNNAPIAEAFAMAPGAVWDGSVGMSPICPGDIVYLPFEIELVPDTIHYFSYASMILPSNDAFVANGNPEAFPVFSASGEFIPVTVESLGSMALDGGTEVNDEIPENTAFFGQTVPNTGVTEGGVVDEHPGFLPVRKRGILADERFAMADFMAEGYQFMEINVYLGEKPPMDECALEFVLFNADTNEALGLLEATVCMEEFEFNIQARPTAACPTTLSAYMELSGEIHQERTENQGPYFIFGDRNAGAEILGRNYRDGDYMITSQIFSERRLQGDLVVEGSMEFTVVDCDRRLRGKA